MVVSPIHRVSFSFLGFIVLVTACDLDEPRSIRRLQDSRLSDAADAGVSSGSSIRRDGPLLDLADAELSVIDALGLPRDGDLDAPELPTEMLLFDQTDQYFTLDQPNPLNEDKPDKGFLPHVRPRDRPNTENWVTPVNFAGGEFRIRYVILNSSRNVRPGRLQICIWNMPGFKPESCASQIPHSGMPGEYFGAIEAVEDWSFKAHGALNFEKPRTFLIRTVLRGEDGCNVTNIPVVNGRCGEQFPRYAGLRFRVTVVLVAQDSSFSGWENYP